MRSFFDYYISYNLYDTYKEKYQYYRYPYHISILQLVAVSYGEVAETSRSDCSGHSRKSYKVYKSNHAYSGYTRYTFFKVSVLYYFQRRKSHCLTGFYKSFIYFGYCRFNLSGKERYRSANQCYISAFYSYTRSDYCSA